MEPNNKMDYFNQKSPIFDEEILNKLPRINEDSVEAGYYFALDRYTACVFHLMRVMEISVHELGRKLGVSLVKEKMWHEILVKVNEQIQSLPPTDKNKPIYAGLSAHLSNVRIAWRNEVMHQIVSTLSRQLSAEYGQGFSRPNLFRMLKFAEFYKDFEIFSTLSRQLSWSHFAELLGIEEEIRRDFYTEMCCIERWSVRNLRDKIQSMLFERTAISKKPDQLIKQELKDLRETHLLTPDFALRDPYILDFLGMKDVYSEKDLELAILREIQSFILELGTDFSFLARQKRITIDGDLRGYFSFLRALFFRLEL